MSIKIRYLVPEFPGQTHTFFWREINALESMGINVDIVSTKIPSTEIMCHKWTKQAHKRTIYLFPPSPKLLSVLFYLFCFKPQKIFRCVKAISFVSKIRLLGLIFIGAELSEYSERQKMETYTCSFVR